MKSKWKIKILKWYEQGITIRDIASKIWNKRPKSNWLSFGIENKTQLKNYLQWAIIENIKLKDLR